MVIEKRKITTLFMFYLTIAAAIYTFVLTWDDTPLFILIGFPIITILLIPALQQWNSRKDYIKLTASYLEVRDNDEVNVFYWEDIKSIRMLKASLSPHSNVYLLVVHLKKHENYLSKFESACYNHELNGGYPLCDLALYKGKKEKNLAKIRQKLRIHQLKQNKPLNESLAADPLNQQIIN